MHAQSPAKPDCIVLPVGLYGCRLHRVEKHLQKVYPDFRRHIIGLGVRVLAQKNGVFYVMVGTFVCWNSLDLGMEETYRVLGNLGNILPEAPRSVGIFLPRRRLNGHLTNLKTKEFPFTLWIHEAER